MRASVRVGSVLLVLTSVLVLAGALCAVGADTARAAYGGVANPSFETAPGSSAYVADSWSLVSQAVVGNAVRLQKDDSTTYPVFAGLNGGTVVTPRTGAWMLRIGIPKGTDSHQAKGVTKVAQTFVSDGSDIGLAYRVFTWEHKDTDVLVIDVKRGTTSVGRLADKEAQVIGATSVITGTGAMPYTLDLRVEPRQAKYLDTGWQDVRITGLESTAGQTLTVTYTLDTNTTAAHDSWVYLDLADIVRPAVSITAPANGSTVTTSTPKLTFSAADDQWGTGLAAGQPVIKVDGTAVTPAPDGSLPTLSDGPHTVTVSAVDKMGNSASATSAFTVQTDSAPPTTSATLSGTVGTNGWYKGAVIVSLAATDVGSGVSATYYSIDGATTPSIYTAPFTVAGDAVHTITCWSTDNAGNTEAPPKTAEVRIDGTGPTLAPSKDPSAEWANGSVDVAANAADALSGLDDVTWNYVKDGGTPVAGSGQTLSPSAEGIYQVAFTATDKAGNSRSADITVQIDMTQPTVSVDVKPIVTPTSPDELPTTNYNRPVIEYSATDDGGSELASDQTSVTLDGNDIAVASGDPLPEPLNSGRHTLAITAADNAGNTATTSYDFTVAAPPFTVQYEHPSEGDVIGLYADDTAKTGNPDGSWEGKTWKWVVSVDGREQLTFDEPVGFLALADKGPYDIELTVTDGTTHAKCVTRQTISAGAQAPWVHALDIEVLDGQPATLVARFLDPGWEQTHQAAWTIDGLDDPVSKSVAEDNFPAMDSGYVAGTTPPLSKVHGDYQGHLTLTDSMGDSTPVDFTITPVSPDPAVDEGQDGSDTIMRPANSPVLHGGQVHLSYIQSADDVDIFEVKTRDGHLLPYGAEVLVTLRDLPEDYDLALIQDLGEEVNANGSLEGSSFTSAAVHSWVDAPVRRGADWEDLPVRRGADWEGVPVRRGADYEGLPVRRGADWSDLPVRRGADLQGLPVRRGAPFIENAYVDSPVRRGADWDAIPVRRGAGWEDVPVRRGAGYVRPPLDTMYFTILSSNKTSLDGYSFLSMGFTGLGSNTASGSTMTFAELGFDNEAMAGLRIADFSAHAGTGMETVWAKTEFVNGHTYIAVKGANGTCSATQPYALQVETSLPLSIYDVLAQDPPQPPLVDPVHQTTATTVEIPPPQSGPLTLFVTQAERLDALYGDGASEPVLDELRLACNDPDGLVRGEVISVPSVLFNDWDAAPWKTSEANKVTEGIRDVIQQYLDEQPSIRYVVLVGSDEVIPQRRAPDQTVLANEGDYFKRSWLKAKGSVAASMYDCTVLTDDYYVDAQPMPYNGRSLYIPDVAVSRLVETPAEINATIQQFLGARGVLAGGSSVVTGQDFMADGAERVRAILAQADLAPEMDDANAWTAGFVRDGLLSAPRSVGNVNGHYVHYGGISAEGWYRSLDDLDWTGEFLSSKELADTTTYPDFVGKLVFTMGCHAGLSVPDDQGGVGDDYAGDPDPRLDIAQAMARRQGVLVGSTGYGYGDTEAIAGTEALIGTFADQMTTSLDANTAKGQPIGLALAEAKRQYLGSLSAVTPYDEKSSIQFAMYGMPQYRLACDAHPPVGGMTVVGVVNPGSAGLDLGFPDTPFDLTVSDAGEPYEDLPTVQLREASTDPTARFITADGDAQATADRAIQPRVVVNLGVGGDDPVKSAIITGGTYVDYAGFNPAISRWTYEWEVDPQEPQVWTDGWWPSNPVTVRTIDTRDGSKQKVIVHPGQFLATSGGENGVTGTERAWISLDVELVRGSAADNIPPTVNTVDLVKSGDTVTAKVNASDASDISRIDVTQDRGGSAVHQSFSPVSVSGDGTYDVSFDAPGTQLSDVAVTIYVVDGAGNVTATDGKGELVPSATHTLTASAGSHGSISPNGTVTASDGADQTYVITPDADCRVADVIVDGVSQGAITSYSFTNVAEDHTIAASFAIDTFGLAVTTTGHGGVAKVPDLPTYAPGSSVTLTANADPGWEFMGWSGDASGTANPLIVTMDSAKSIGANFVDSASLLQLTTLAGSPGQIGSADGSGSAARFRGPVGVACDAAGNVYVTDTYNDTIRKITPTGDVTTLAGSVGQAGSADGTGGAARFDLPHGIACDAAGNVYVGDWNNNTVRKIDSAGQVTTFAGSPGNPGSADGTGSAASFYNAGALACDAAGNVYVADFAGNTVRKITPAGVVTTLAGSAPSAGSADGAGSAARFNSPQGIACDAAGNLYVADTFNDTIRKVTPAGEVTTLAGSPGRQGSADGTGSAARFYWPAGIACDAAGTIYVADYGNDTIRRITPSGVVTTVAGSVGVQGSADGTGSVAGLFHPQGVASDAVGNLYIADFMNDTIRKAVCPATAGGFIRVTQSSGGTISLAGQTGAAPATVPVQHGDAQAFTITPDAHYRIGDVLVDGVSQGPLASTYAFSGVTADHTIMASFVPDQLALTVTPSGQGSVAKLPEQATYDYGSSVQLTAEADPGWQFSLWTGDASGTTNPLTVTMDRARSITPIFTEALQVTTRAGTAGQVGSVDAIGSAASFNTPIHVACDSAGNVYVADNNNHTIRKITPAGSVSTLAGSPGQPGTSDSTDLTGGSARFRRPWGVVCDTNDTIYVADSSNNTIRKITPDGVVTTLAGSAGIAGSDDGLGAAARFSTPTGIACDAAGNLYVADTFNNIVRRVTPTGVVTTLAGSAGSAGSNDGLGAAATFNFPVAVACDAGGNVFVADQGNNTIRKITPAGDVTTLAGLAGQAGSTDGAGNAARFDAPTGIAVDANGSLYVADYNGDIIRKVSPAGVVTTVAGLAGHAGGTDGAGSDARFSSPAGIAIDPAGNIYVPDADGNTIRKAVCPSTVGGFIRVTQSSGGTISLQGQTMAAPAAVTVQHGTDQSVTITPDAHCQLVDVLIDGVSQGAITNYTFYGVNADHTIGATFSTETRTLSYTAGAHGSISGPNPQPVEYGSDGSQVTAVPDPGYHFAGWSDGKPTAARTDANVTADLSVTASFAVDPVAPVLTSPIGSENWVVGSPHTISWTPGNGGPVTITLSRDGVGNWETLFSAAPNDGFETWTPTGPPTTQALIQISNDSGWDVSAALFSIELGQAPDAPALAAPNGGESWIVGTSHTITWTPGNGGPVEVELSRDGGTNWETLAASTPNTGSLSWTVSGAATSQAAVRISNSGGSDTSNAAFTIVAAVGPTVIAPNGGESWIVGTSHTITWTPGNGGPVEVELSRDGGTNWETLAASTPNTGSLSWTVSGAATSQAAVRISNSGGSDTSNAAFTIVAAVGPTVIAPNGGESWIVGTSHTITWTPGNGGPVRIELSLDGGSTWPVVVSSSTANTGSYSWIAPNSPTTQARVRISNSSGSSTANASFTIAAQVGPTVIAPNGGESWIVGTSHTITWTPGNGGPVRIELSLDGGSTWPVVVSSSTANTGSYAWTAPSNPTTRARIRISNVYGFDTSNANFTIAAQIGPVVTSPAGGEYWTSGTVQAITWTTGNGGPVKIEYSVAGTSWYTIIASTPNDGSYGWTVVPTGGTGFGSTIRISNSYGSDTSPGFRVVPSGPRR